MREGLDRPWVLDPQVSTGMQHTRPVGVVRQRIRGGIVRERRVDGKQVKLDLAGPSVREGNR